MTPGPRLGGYPLAAQAGLDAGETGTRKAQTADGVQVGGQNSGLRQHGVTVAWDLGVPLEGERELRQGPRQTSE